MCTCKCATQVYELCASLQLPPSQFPCPQGSQELELHARGLQQCVSGQQGSQSCWQATRFHALVDFLTALLVGHTPKSIGFPLKLASSPYIHAQTQAINLGAGVAPNHPEVDQKSGGSAPAPPSKAQHNTPQELEKSWPL